MDHEIIPETITHLPGPMMLRGNETTFRVLVEQTIVGYYVIQDDRFVYVNPRLTEILGYSAEELTSRPVFEFIAVEDRALAAENIRKRFSGTVSSIRYRLRMCHRDGRIIRAEVHGTKAEYAGKPSIIGVLLDKTEQINAEEGFERLAALVACCEDAIVATDPHGMITDWNAGAERLFGYTATEVTGRSNLLLVPPEDMARAVRITQELQQGIEFQPYEAVRVRRDGRTVVVSVRLSHIKDKNRIVGFSVIYRDLTNTKKLEEQLRQAQKMEAVGQLAGGIAHDFNNLLTVISGYSQIVLTKLPPGEEREQVDQIYKAGERAARLTRQLLAFSRKQVLEPRVLDLNVVVDEAGKMLRRLIGEDIILTTVLASDLNAVKVDAGQIEQVIINLVVNARDAMPQGGQVTIETRNVDLDEGYARLHMEVRPGKYVLLAVSDTGCGMDEATKARIFEPFFTTKRLGEGTGLGLATVYGIVKQSGGHLSVYSEVGHGTSFKIYLPIVRDTVPTDESLHGMRVSIHGSESVLLVEDEEAVRGLSRMALQMYGYTVIEACNADDAIRIGKEHSGPIHLLATDVVMPGMSGRQLAESLRSLRKLRVLFLSGYTDDAVVRHGVLEAEADFLQKPFTPTSLANKVRQILDRPIVGT
jgi:PAS domain S-box-containing protein